MLKKFNQKFRIEKNGPEMKILEEQIRQLDEQIKILNQTQSDENYNVNG